MKNKSNKPSRPDEVAAEKKRRERVLSFDTGISVEYLLKLVAVDGLILRSQTVPRTMDELAEEFEGLMKNHERLMNHFK